ncbi:MAG: N-acetylglucosamine-6-phosphate deacetylase [Fimbriimonadaceae bacterium]|nr:N-acetylglucosamine-6-phosphate deacetylase [Fimbriimonadaceae bacterium]
MREFIAEAIGPAGFGPYRIGIRANGVDLERVDGPSEGYFLPGFVDLHIHGGFGIDFMSSTAEQMATLDGKLADLGYDTYLPTTVTAEVEHIRSALASLSGATHASGFHLEGPFISPAYPGAQDPARITGVRIGEPAWEAEWQAVLEDPRLRIVTLAPEVPNALELTSRLMKRGVIVSMGHSNATYDEARYGFEFGATHVTHVFNAMRGIHHREFGLAGYALLNPDIATEVVYDRRHVSREAIALLLKVKPPDRIIAVSDGTKAIGLAPKTDIQLWGRTAVVGDGEVRLADGTLAGSTITLLHAFKNLTDDFGAEVAIRVCSLNPAKAIGHTPRRYLLLDYSLNLIGTWSVEAL